MDSAETDVKRAAEHKLWLEEKIAELEEEVGRLKMSLEYVDAFLRASTFRSASEMLGSAQEPEVRELRRDKGTDVIAKATITPEGVSIEPAEGLELRSATTPFRSFLISKILQGMKSGDMELVTRGKLARGTELAFDVEEKDGAIARLTVENYRDKARLNEILNTVAWTFSKMLEK